MNFDSVPAKSVCTTLIVVDREDAPAVEHMTETLCPYLPPLPPPSLRMWKLSLHFGWGDSNGTAWRLLHFHTE